MNQNEPQQTIEKLEIEIKQLTKRVAKLKQDNIVSQSICWAILVVGLWRTNPTTSDFSTFIRREGFFLPNVERSDYMIGSFYKVKGISGEERAYVGFFRSFYRISKFDRPAN